MTLRCIAIILSLSLLQNCIPIATAHSQEAKDTKTTELRLPTDKQSSPMVNFVLSLSPEDKSADNSVTLSIQATVKDGWHIYPLGETEEGLPTKIEFLSSTLEPVEKQFQLNSSEATQNESAKHLKGEFTWTRKYRVLPKAKSIDGEGSISFQVCEDDRCLPPTTLKFSFANPKSKQTGAQHKFVLLEKPVVVALEECKVTRPKAKLSTGGTLLSIFSGGLGEDKLSLQGKLTVDGDSEYEIYLPKRRKLKLENTGQSNSRFENKADYVSVDQNRDGELDRNESYAMNLPIRIEDSMFMVTGYDKAASEITFRKVQAPLSGTIVGRKCPPFKFESLDGEIISNKSILGKVTILDIWAVT